MHTCTSVSGEYDKKTEQFGTFLSLESTNHFTFQEGCLIRLFYLDLFQHIVAALCAFLRKSQTIRAVSWNPLRNHITPEHL